MLFLAAALIVPTLAAAKPCRESAQEQTGLYPTELADLKKALAARGRPVRVAGMVDDLPPIDLVVKARKQEPFDLLFWQLVEEDRAAPRDRCLHARIRTIAYGRRSELLGETSLHAYGWKGTKGTVTGAYPYKDSIGVLRALRVSLPAIAALSPPARPSAPESASSAGEQARQRAYAACATGQPGALERWDEAIALAPKDESLHLFRAKCRAETDVAGKLADLTRGLTVEPKWFELRRARIELRGKSTPKDAELAADVEHLIRQKNVPAGAIEAAGLAVLDAERAYWDDGDGSGAARLRALARRAFEECLSRPTGEEFAGCHGSLRWLQSLEEDRSRR